MTANELIFEVRVREVGSVKIPHEKLLTLFSDCVNARTITRDQTGFLKFPQTFVDVLAWGANSTVFIDFRGGNGVRYSQVLKDPFIFLSDPIWYLSKRHDKRLYGKSFILSVATGNTVPTNRQVVNRSVRVCLESVLLCSPHSGCVGAVADQDVTRHSRLGKTALSGARGSVKCRPMKAPSVCGGSGKQGTETMFDSDLTRLELCGPESGRRTHTTADEVMA